MSKIGGFFSIFSMHGVGPKFLSFSILENATSIYKEGNFQGLRSDNI